MVPGDKMYNHISKS